jgi:hemerythrin
MAPIAWKPEYSVGDPAVDHEHKKLVDLVNAAAGAILDGRPDADVDRSLGDLYRAISAHFAHEEKQMRRAAYNQYHVHKADHERLLDALRDFMDGVHETADSAKWLTAVLETWFTHHLRTHDALLHSHLGPHDH